MILSDLEHKQKSNEKNNLDSAPKIYYYIEQDGKVYLIEKDTFLQFPSVTDSLPFKIIEKKRMEFDGFTSIYCGTDLERYPEEWHSKDEIAGFKNLHYTVRLSLHMSFPRCVAGGVMIQNKKVLMVKASRGVTKGGWNIPGGFIEYGESPAECIVRELKEEIGIDAVPKTLLGVYDKDSGLHPYHLISFVYLCEAEDYNLVLDPDEIEEADWFEIDEAIKITRSYFTEMVLKEHENELG